MPGRFLLRLILFVLLYPAWISNAFSLTCSDLNGAYLYSQESIPVDLGFFGNTVASESINNSIGTHGSTFSSTSVRTSWSNYGSSYGSYSAMNSSASSPPAIFKNQLFIGYLTNNPNKLYGISLADIDSQCYFNAQTKYDTPLNTAPTATNLSAPESFIKNAAAFSLTDIVITDPDSLTVTATLTLSDYAGTFSTAISGTVTSTFYGKTWSASGPVANVNALLASLTFTPAEDWDKSFTISTSVSDGVAAAVTGTKQVTVTVPPVSDAFSITCADLDGAYLFSQESPQVYLGFFGNAVASGSINNSIGTYGSTFSSTSVRTTWSNYGSSYGSYSAMNSSASSPPAIFKNQLFIGYLTNNPYKLYGISLAAIDSVCTFYSSTFDDTPLNTAPKATNLSAPEAFTEDAAAFSLTDIVITDLDSLTVTATLTLSDYAGTLSTATSGTVTSTFDGKMWSASGPVANVNTLLAGLTFRFLAVSRG